MDLNKINMMSLLQDNMKFHAAKQAVIAENIANVDTPDYLRKDIENPSFKGMVKTHMLTLQTTNPKHINGLNAATEFAPFTSEKPVELDMEALELMKNNNDFAKASSTYKKMIGLIETAIEGNGSR